jgi:hypothetical protein
MKLGVFGPKMQKTGSWGNESTVFARAGGCNGRFWAMIVQPVWGRFAPVSRRRAGPGGARAGRLITDR